MRILIGLALLLAASGCSNSSENRPATIASALRTDLNIDVDTVDPVPVQEMAAGIMLHRRGEKSYVFFDDFSGTAVMVLDRMERQLQQLVDESNPEGHWDKAFTQRYRGEGYDVELKLHQSKAHDEGGDYEGEIEIRRAKATETVPVEGEVGS